MNEELLNELTEALKRRDRANAAIVRWTEQRDDAEDDIQELSTRITDAHRVENPAGPEPEPVTHYGSYEPVEYAPEQVSVQE